ncbi:THAP domain-containing protein 5-like [Plodia interpunctella]|uniref:THAP domain-containing protein 5-like n=1 Tax=Plodia interpunctella TaxID=58824 RepID=UPI002367633C|nr:THAP domain-containing protein 5-like [Plodia interpunctella]
MTRCSVLECKNNSGTKNLLRSGISYHRFPRDPHIKEKWINATGRIKWMPTKCSSICSEHFAENEILITEKGYRVIDPNAIPTKKIMSYQVQDKVMASNSSKTNILEEPGSISEPPTKKPCISMAHSLKDPVNIINLKPAHKTTTKSKEASSENKSTSILCLSSNVTPTKKKLVSMLRFAKSTITKKNLKIKRLQARNRRLKQKLDNMEQLLNTLEEKFCISNEN